MQRTWDFDLVFELSSTSSNRATTTKKTEHNFNNVTFVSPRQENIMVKFFVDNKRSNRAGLLACYIVSQATGVPLETTPTTVDKKDPQYAALSAQLPQFNNISPFGRAPVFVVDQQRSVYLFDVLAIVRFMASKSTRWPQWHTATAAQKAGGREQVLEEMWLEWLTSKLNNGELGIATEELARRIEDALKSNTESISIIGGSGVTLADICAWSVVYDLVSTGAIADLSAYQRTQQWFQQLTEEKMFQAGVKAAKLEEGGQ